MFFITSLNSDNLKDSKSYASELKVDSLSCALEIAETLQLQGSDSLCPCHPAVHTPLLPFSPQKTGPGSAAASMMRAVIHDNSNQEKGKHSSMGGKNNVIPVTITLLLGLVLVGFFWFFLAWRFF